VRSGHTGFIAGLIGRLAPGSLVIVRKVLDREGWGEEDRVAGLLHAYAGKVDPVNVSMGPYTPIQPRVLETACARSSPGWDNHINREPHHARQWSSPRRATTPPG
jgi:hypothetical protein